MPQPTNNPAPRVFTISRTFNAPRELLFRVLTQPEHLSQWWGPAGCTVTQCKIDLRVGGVFHYALQFGKDLIWGRWVFREVAPPTKLVFLSSFSDELAGVTRHPMAPVWPAYLLSTITLTEHDGKTTCQLDWTPYEASAEERAAFDAAFASMTGGWTGTFNQLQAYLEKIAR